MTPSCWHILSYPRSGNHAVRTIIERYTGRPTLGCPGNQVQDKPIFLREKNKRIGLIKITDQRPIGRKSHYPREMLFHDAHEDGAGIILITRDPVKAIVSHLGPRWKPKGLFRAKPKIDWERLITTELDHYIALLCAFRAMPDRARIHIRFEDIVDPQSGAAGRLLSTMGFPQIDPGSLEATLGLAFDSLQRPGGRTTRPELTDHVRTIVNRHISYDDVMRLVAV